MAAGSDKKTTGEFNSNFLNDLNKSFSDRAEDEMDVVAQEASYDFSLPLSKSISFLPVMDLYRSEQEAYNELLRIQNENGDQNLHVELQRKKKILEYLSHAITKVVADDACSACLSMEGKECQEQAAAFIGKIKKEREDN